MKRCPNCLPALNGLILGACYVCKYIESEDEVARQIARDLEHSRAGMRWSHEDETLLANEWNAGTPCAHIAHALKRPLSAVLGRLVFHRVLKYDCDLNIWKLNGEVYMLYREVAEWDGKPRKSMKGSES